MGAGGGTQIPAAFSTENGPDFLKSLSKEVSSCSKWRELLKDVLGFASGSTLPCGLTVNLEKPQAPPPPSDKSSPLSPAPRTPSPSHHQTFHGSSPSASASAPHKKQKVVYAGVPPPSPKYKTLAASKVATLQSKKRVDNHSDED